MRKALLILPCFFSLIVLAHKPVKVQSLEDAVAKYAEGEPKFEDWSKFENPKFLKAVSVAALEEVTFFKFEAAGDWGPIHGLIAIEDDRVAGLEILVYTQHAGAGVTQSAFLDQFKALTKANHAAIKIKPLPKEPLTSLALKEAVDAIFQGWE